uniref:Uncharacterized protein n=1 Tax=viral metagenome TaxID=1070528 RepID=A0A6M3II53_9ZZZZ
MADRTIHANEIILNGVKFPIDGFVRESLISRFPAAMRIGAPDYANEQLLSNWIINDATGGLLIEEMDESIHQDRYWWSTCDTRFRSNILLPPLPSGPLTLPSNVTAPSIVNANMETDAAGWTGGDRSAAQYHTGSYSWAIASGSAYQDLVWDDAYKGKAFVFGCWVYCEAGGATAVIIIDDAIGTSSSKVITGGAAWVHIYVTRTLAATATRLRLTITRTGASGSTFADDATLVGQTIGTVPLFVNFNSKQYAACGYTLVKMNAGNTGYDPVGCFPTVITDLVVGSDGNLLIYLGDSDYYWWMTTAELFYNTDASLANKGLRWDGKTWKMAANGRWWYTVTPSTASPAWTAADASGGLDDYTLTPKSLDVYRDANGNLIPYCATTKGLWAYDIDTSMWVETEVGLPEHTQAGMGLVVWQDGIYVSGGLSVKKYIAAGTATLTEVGLSQDDGLPQLRSGEIVKFIKGYDEFFALIDSTYEGATSRSQVVSYDGTGWRTWWEATADNKNMYAGIVTSVNKHQLLFSTTDGVYSIPLQRTSRNPKKVAGYTYNTSGIHISPRFDAGTKAFPKLATKLTLFLDDMSATETVAVSYQIDQAQGALTSAWTSLVAAQTADGVKEQTFGTNGVGVVFYDIQFRLALAQAGANTTSPIVKGMVLSFLKLLGRKKAWTFTISTSEAGRVGATPKELTDALSTILSTNTLMLFTFRDGSAAADTHYVIVQPYSSFTAAGPNWMGQANLTCVEV